MIFQAISVPSFLLGMAHLASAIEWGSCPDAPLVALGPSDLPIKCAILPVPLDSTDKSSNEMLLLDLIKIDAATQPAKGSILINFRGPGSLMRGVRQRTTALRTITATIPFRRAWTATGWIANFRKTHAEVMMICLLFCLEVTDMSPR